jgi:hypothetical protein
VGGGPLFDAWTRLRLVVALILLSPPALVASLLEACLRTGATVHVVARRG